MTGKAFVALAVATSFSMLAIVSAVAASDRRSDDRGGRETGVLRAAWTGLIRFITPRFSAMPQPPRPLASSDQPMAPGTCDPVAGVDRGRLMARRREAL